jgi:DNA-binding GntR family transcriptional regulator
MVSAYDRVRRLVLDGELGHERPVAEVPLASQLGVSRPTVREALRRLEGEGLLRSDGRRLRVIDLDGAELAGALRMRAALEELHAELAAERVSAGHVAEAQIWDLEKKAAVTAAATAAGDHDEAGRLNRDFHRAVNLLAANPVSFDALELLWDQVLLSTARSLAPPDRAAAVDREHSELLDAIKSGDGARAGKLARAHVLATLSVLS